MLRALSAARVLTGSRLIALLFTLGTAAVVACSPGCHGADDPNKGNKIRPTVVPPGWTVLVYGIGRNECGNVTNNMISAIQTSQLTVYEAAVSQTNVVSPPFSTTNRMQVFQGVQGVPDDVRGSQNMVDPAEFENFLEFGIRIAPAPHFLLILEGHGGFPINGLGSENVGVISTLDLASIDGALGTARANTGLTAFDIIGTDMPFGLNMESLAVFQKHATYACGFAGCAAPSGFDYNAISAAINANFNVAPSILAPIVANTIIPHEAAQAGTLTSDTVVQATPITLANVPGIMSAFDAFAASLLTDLTTLPGTLAMIGSMQRTVANYDQHLGANLIDVGVFVSSIAQITSAPAVSATTKLKAKAFMTALNLGFTSALDYPFARGVGIYFPHAKKYEAPTYSTAAAALLTAAPNWGALLSTYYSALSSGAVTPTVTMAVPGVISVSGPFTISGTVSPALLCYDINVLLTVNVGGVDQVVARIPIGAPDPPLPNPVGSWSYTGTMFFHQMTDSTGLVLPCFTPLARNKNQTSVAPGLAGSIWAIDCDVAYSVAGVSTVTFPGIYKAEFQGPPLPAPATAVQFTGWTPIGKNGAFGHDDILSAGGGLGYTIYPHFVFVSPTGIVTHSSQTTFGYTRGAGDKLIVGTPAPGSYKIWVVAESLNGDIGFLNQPVTLVP